MRAVLLVVPLLLVAGCLEGGGPAPTPTTGAVTTTPTATPTPLPPIENVTFRSLENGTMMESGESAREVFDDPTSWHDFYVAHHKVVLEGDGAQPPPPTPPDVDFETERAVAVLMGEQPNGCYHIRVTEVTREAGDTVVHVTTFLPSPEMACIFVVTQPYHYVAIPRVDGDVRFEEREVSGGV